MFPATTLEICIVHLIRSSLDYASWKERKALAAAIKPIYTAPSAEAAQGELDAFEQRVRKFPTVVAAWCWAWSHVSPFFAFPAGGAPRDLHDERDRDINARLRKIIKTRGHFPSDDAASKLIWLARYHGRLGRAAHNWKEAMNQFAILYADRFTKTAAKDEPSTCPPRRSFVASDARRRGQVPSASHTKIQTLPGRARVGVDVSDLLDGRRAADQRLSSNRWSCRRPNTSRANGPARGASASRPS